MRGRETFIQRENEVTNRFELKLNHQGDREYKLTFETDDKAVTIITPMNPLVINTHEKRAIIFFKFKTDVLTNGSKKIIIKVFDQLTKTYVASKEVVLVGPI